MSKQPLSYQYDLLTLIQEQTESLINMLAIALEAKGPTEELRGAVSVIQEKHDESQHATDVLWKAIQKSAAHSDQKQPESRAKDGLETAAKACPEGGDQTASDSPTGRMDAGCGVVTKVVIDAIDNLIDCTQSDGMFEMDPDGDGTAPDDRLEARAALLALLQNQQQIIPEIIQPASPWVLSQDAQPDAGVQVICLDVNTLDGSTDVNTATRTEGSGDWMGRDAVFWWMHVPPLPDGGQVDRSSETQGNQVDESVNLQRDAGRYRWLRDNDGVDNEHQVEVYIGDMSLMPGLLTEHIYEEMRQEGQS